VASAGQALASARETVAAIDPSLVAGRGAQLGIVEQEAENATTNGTILPFDTSAYTLSGEASGRQAVKLAPGEYVAFTLTQPANAITIRYAIPDAPSGGGIDAPLTVGVERGGHGNTHPQTITLTSKYAYLYNQYPFTNDPAADLLHPDWWITECSCVPAFTTPRPSVTKPFRPMHFYDEQRVLLHHTYEAGDVLGAAGGFRLRQRLRRRSARHSRLRRRVRPRDSGGEGRSRDRLHPGRHLPGEQAHHRR
jgi:hypothetical protein